jgi:hypothetical protein
MAQPDPNPFQQIITWLKATADWVAQNLGDPAIASALRADLGLKPSQDIVLDSAAVKNKFLPFAGVGLDPEVESFQATVLQVLEILPELKALAEDPNVDGWDVAFLIGTVAAADTLRVRLPALYAIAKLTLLISDDPDSIDRFDPTLLVKLLTGRLPSTAGRDFFNRASNSLALIPPIIDHVLTKVGQPDMVDFFYGWEPIPDTATPVADVVSQRALTMLIGPKLPAPPSMGSAQMRGAITLIGVPDDHGGPGMIMTLGGDYKAKAISTDAKLEVDVHVGGAGALSLFIPFGGQDVLAKGDPQLFFKVDVARKGKAGKPAFVIGDPKETRLQIGKIGAGIEVTNDRAALKFKIEDGALIITPGKADSFLKTIISDDIKIGFDFKAKIDSKKGFSIEGGTGLKATIPVQKTVLDTLTIHHITIGLAASTRPGNGLALEASGAFGLKLGPFQASVDRLGFTLDMAFRDGNLGLVEAEFAFKPPNGLGLLLDAGVIKGGGYLYIDHQRGEYAGALELKLDLPMVKIGIKAIGVLTTKMPDGEDGWALLLLVYGQFPPIQLSWGFTLTGIGGMIGLQHGVSVDAMIAGMKSGALDDVMFPANPVADAPRIINRFRTVFPVTRRALTIGLFVEMGWGGAVNLITIRAGVLVQLDNVLGEGTGTPAFGRLLILGQLLIQLAPGVPSDLVVLKLLVDFVGYIEVNPLRIGFVSRLRDSYFGKKPLKIDFAGMMVVQAVFGDRPSFVLANGGFHPQFTDIPAGLPSPIDRVSAAISINIVKLKIEAYYAITPASVQAGANAHLKVKLGPVEVEARLGFDAIVYLVPVTRFDVKIYGSASIKFKGHRLAGIGFEFRLEGPGQWRARGFGKFSILLWDVEVPFDESWGSTVEAAPPAQNAAALLATEISSTGNWAAQLPLGGEPLINLAKISGGAALLAHPLGTLQFTQRLLPFDLQLQKLGPAPITGANQFGVASGFIGDPARSQPVTPLPQHFAVGEYRHLTDAQKLTSPGFQSFTAGAQFGSTAYTAGPAAPDQGMEYETLYLEPEPDFPHSRLVRSMDRIAGLSLNAAGRMAMQGAAARSLQRANDRLKPATATRISVGDAPVATATTTTMASNPVVLTPAQQAAPALARFAIAQADGVQVVEAFELA